LINGIFSPPNRVKSNPTGATPDFGVFDLTGNV
jgi:hypothetical protein